MEEDAPAAGHPVMKKSAELAPGYLLACTCTGVRERQRGRGPVQALMVQPSAAGSHGSESDSFCSTCRVILHITSQMPQLQKVEAVCQAVS